MSVKIRSNKLFYTLVIIAIIATGFIREYLFYHLNYQWGKLYYREFYNSSDYNYELPPSLTVFNALSYSQLYWFKWLLSGFFALAYFGYSWLVVNRMFPGSRQARKITIWVHALILSIAVLFFFYGYLPGQSQNGYMLSLAFMHILQSPLVLMLLVPGFRLARFK
jgi:hypothetical protein